MTAKGEKPEKDKEKDKSTKRKDHNTHILLRAFKEFLKRERIIRMSPPSKN